MEHWIENAVFYHIYPLGLCGAPHQNDFSSSLQPRLQRLTAWRDHILGLGCNTVYLGPLFESSSHGYDTADYFHVDRRLGTNQTLIDLVADFHAHGIRVILDGVFNHVGRNFWAFRDVQENGQNSAYTNWFAGLKFGTPNRYGDPFTYDTWNGFDSLVKLNLKNPQVRAHLLEAVRQWITDYQIDGLRLDTADCLDLDFQKELSVYCRKLQPDFWLMGEVIHGDYSHWANPAVLDSTTNYECYKGLFSSHNDRNYFEIAYSLNRQFGEGGIYRELPLYAFADNHDVDRVAFSLKDKNHLFPLYTLLFGMPGVPSIYYGSEFGISAGKASGDDWNLRPELELGSISANPPVPGLADWISRCTQARHALPALRSGGYRQAFVASEQFAFWREVEGQTVLVAVNASAQEKEIRVVVPRPNASFMVCLEDGRVVTAQDNMLALTMPPNSGNIYHEK
jgi:glycosidase